MEPKQQNQHKRRKLSTNTIHLQQPNKTKSYQPNPQTTHPTKVGKNHNTHPFTNINPKPLFLT